LWGTASLWPLLTSGRVSQLVAILVIVSISSTSPVGYGSYLPAFHAFFFGAMLPLTIALPLRLDWLRACLCALAIVDMVVVVGLAWRSNMAFTNALTLRFANAALAEDLRARKEAAERASTETSRFLAAASHDLRQPVHAMSLFIGALRERALDADTRQLVTHLDETVTSLQDLFGDLLDISRLDAGVVTPRLETVPIGPLLARIVQAHAAEAAGKGISLRLSPCSAVAWTDPALLDRILRNLVSNAVRYTDRGRVLIGCRRGARLRIEVWDTGRGIAAADRERIFDEFTQIDHPGRDRTKGIGLGLAIVRRLCALLDCPLTLRSEPGAGSVFAVSVRLADRARVEPRAPTLAEPDPARGDILVIDDEAAIRDGMRALLTSWHYTVRVAASGADALDALASADRPPDLLICDLRLPDGNGIDLIARLRTRLGFAVPALLITGDTAPERLREAAGSGLLLLHKPVARARLRAAVGHLIRQGD
jgi:signal transduction histidine kinase/CheY-like chemotaxis protein